MSQYAPRYELTEIKEAGVNGEQVGQYSKRISIVDVIDQDGMPWEPVPGPDNDPWDDLVIAQKATWSDGNVYAVGETISAVSATYVGGSDGTIYRSRSQHKNATDESWTNGEWQPHTNTPQIITFTIPAGTENGQVRLQTHARDNGVDPAVLVSSTTNPKQINDLDWDPITATVNDIEYDLENAPALTVLINDPLPIVVTHNGAITDATYQWESRNPPAAPLFGTPTAKNTVVTFAAEGYYILTLSMRSPKADEIKSILIQFYVVDAL